LDPLLQREFAALVRESITSGAGVLLSSHVLSELEGLADRVAVLRDGALVALESITDLRARAASMICLRFASDEQARGFISSVIAESVDQQDDGVTVNVTFTGDVDSIIKTAARFHVTSLESTAGELDDVFLGFYTGQADS